MITTLLIPFFLLIHPFMHPRVEVSRKRGESQLIWELTFQDIYTYSLRFPHFFEWGNFFFERRCHPSRPFVLDEEFYIKIYRVQKKKKKRRLKRTKRKIRYLFILHRRKGFLFGDRGCIFFFFLFFL